MKSIIRLDCTLAKFVSGTSHISNELNLLHWQWESEGNAMALQSWNHCYISYNCWYFNYTKLTRQGMIHTDWDDLKLCNSTCAPNGFLYSLHYPYIAEYL
jgi:hypothetical protein